MKSPIPVLLYLTSAGLFGLAGWTVYEMLPLWKDSVRAAATQKGQDEGSALLTRGNGQNEVVAEWKYTPATASWWGMFREANLIGKLPPPPPVSDADKPPPPPPTPPVKTLEEIFELVAIVHDTEAGAGGNSHVILRYKPEANVQPPEWYVRENTAAAAAPAGGGPRDVTANRTGAARPPAPPPKSAGAPRPTNPNSPASPMPVSSVGRDFLQKAWVDDGGDPRRSAKLWEPYSDIRLVAVAADAQSAFFVRTPPPPKDGETAKEPVREEMLKTSLGLSQDLVKEIFRMQGRGEPNARRDVAAAPNPSTKWMDVEETTVVGNTVNIGRKDEQRFRENSDEFLAQLNLDTYVSKSSNLKGLQVRNVDRQIATQFGIQETDVLVELNGRSVQTKAQAMQLGKADYQRGVRTFHTKWWSNGQMVERIYQAPDK